MPERRPDKAVIMTGFRYFLQTWALCMLASCFAVNGNTVRQFAVADDTIHGPVCYSCDLLTDPSACGYKVRCGRDEVCMLHEVMPGIDGRKRYTAHCETETVCQNMVNHAKRAHVFCNNCCKQDLCNNHCGDTPTKPPPVPSTPTVATTTATTTTTTLKSTTLKPTTLKATTLKATTLEPATLKPTTTALRTTKAEHPVVYPIMCYSCHDMLHPGDCKHLVTCAAGHGCMLQESGRDSDGQTLYISACEPDWLCKAMSRHVSLIGKREEENQSDMRTEVGRRAISCNKCCHNHLCNNHCDVISDPTTPTQAPTIKPTTPTTHAPTTASTTQAPTTASTTQAPTTKPTSPKSQAPTTKPTTHKTQAPATKPTTASTTQAPATKPTTIRNKQTSNVFSATTLHTAATQQSSTVQSNILSETERCKTHNFTSVPYIHLCFKLETVELKWSVAERWCGFYGATLAELDDPGKFSVIQTLLKYEPHFKNEVTYIGAHDTYGNQTFYWPRGNRVTLGSWSGLNFQHTTQKCIGLDGTNGFEMKFVDCQTYRKFICTIDTS